MRVADFFCGAGGFSEGFRQMGFNIVFGLDNWRPAIDTITLNHPGIDAKCMNILDIDTPKKIDEIVPYVEVIIGSPPCVAFSGSNKAGKADKGPGVRLIEQFLKIIAWKKNKPNSILKYWILENVPNSVHYIKDEYTFKDLSCGDRQCTVSFTARHKNGNRALMSSVTVKGYSAVMEGETGDRLRGVTDSFTDSLSMALGKWEDEALAP